MSAQIKIVVLSSYQEPAALKMQIGVTDMDFNGWEKAPGVFYSNFRRKRDAVLYLFKVNKALFDHGRIELEEYRGNEKTIRRQNILPFDCVTARIFTQKKLFS
jgi:hypothetical protein